MTLSAVERRIAEMAFASAFTSGRLAGLSASDATAFAGMVATEAVLALRHPTTKDRDALKMIEALKVPE